MSAFEENMMQLAERIAERVIEVLIIKLAAKFDIDVSNIADLDEPEESGESNE